MPSIEITDEQARSLASGQNITIKPPAPPKPIVAVGKAGNVYLLVEPRQSDLGDGGYQSSYSLLRCDGDNVAATDCPVISNGLFTHREYTFVEVAK